MSTATATAERDMSKSSEAAPERPMTAEEFFALPDNGTRYELVRGRLVEVTFPNFEHADVQFRIAELLRPYLRKSPVGRCVGTTATQTEEDPDSVRGPDACFYSFTRLPKDLRPRDWPDIAPEVAFEIWSPSNRPGEMLTKVGEFLEAGVLCVVVLNAVRGTVVLYTPEADPVILRGQDRLKLPNPLEEWNPTVAELLEDE